MSFKTLEKLTKKSGMKLTEQNYLMMKNMSFEEFIRSFSLVSGNASKMPQVEIPFTLDLSNEIEDEKTLREVSGDIKIGVAADFNQYELEKEGIMELITDNFNSFTFTNSMKWNHNLKKENEDYRDYNFEKIDKALEELNKANVRVRGHNLLWGKFVGMTFPISVKTEVENSEDKVATLKRIIDERLTDALGHYKGKVSQWDVLNETVPYSSEFTFDGYFFEIMGQEYIDYIFKKAREIDPDVELYLNEALGDFSGDKGKSYINWLEERVKLGVPIDGIGIQGHVTRGKWDIAGFDFFASELERLGVDFEITELDMSVAPLRENENAKNSQAEYIYKIVSTALKHKNCKGITFWGLSDVSNWYDAITPFDKHAPNEPNPFDNNYEKKPMYYAVKKALIEANKNN